MPTPPSAHDASSNDVDPIKQFETIVDAISADGNQACSQPQSEQNPEVLFVDKAVEGFKSIVADFVDCRETEVFFINHGSAGLAQIADHLEGRSGIDAIHIISHENDGQLNLGNSAIDQGQLSGQYSSELIRIGQSLTDSGNILIYGCDIESSDTCARFIEEFTSLTDAEVAISTASKPKNTVVEFKTTASSSNSFTRVPLETDAGFVVGTESFANMNEIAITPQSQGGVSTRVYENTATANNGTSPLALLSNFPSR